MFKSTFAKYFTVTVSVLLVAMIALGAVQLLFVNSYWSEEKRVQLTENAEQIAQHTASVAVKDGSVYYISPRSIKPIVNLLSGGLDSNILVVDTDGNILVSSDNAPIRSTTISESIIQSIGNSYFEISDLDGLFATKQYAAATPIIMQSNVRIGYVITTMPADGLTGYLTSTLRTYLLSALVVLLVFSIIIYLLVYRLVKPLRQMAEVTRHFAQGDFSCRVPVKGRDEVAELASSLNSMAVSLSATENMSRSFVANVSHELKTPMTTISGFIDGILDGTIPREKQDYYLKIVSDEVKRLSRLVKSMLDLSRIDNGSLKINPVLFDLTDTACSALLSFEQRIEAKHIEIEGLADCGRVMVTADHDLIGQVVYNLLDNAVKFVNENGVIGITINRMDDRVYCTVRNSGAGLAAEEMPRVFERFYKTDRSRSLDKTGVGLGLYIVKTVINLHRGEIYVRSVQGEYCEFTFWLPVGGPEEGAKPDRLTK